MVLIQDIVYIKYCDYIDQSIGLFLNRPPIDCYDYLTHTYTLIDYVNTGHFQSGISIISTAAASWWFYLWKSKLHVVAESNNYPSRSLQTYIQVRLCISYKYWDLVLMKASTSCFCVIWSSLIIRCSFLVATFICTVELHLSIFLLWNSVFEKNRMSGDYYHDVVNIVIIFSVCITR